MVINPFIGFIDPLYRFPLWDDRPDPIPTYTSMTKWKASLPAKCWDQSIDQPIPIFWQLNQQFWRCSALFLPKKNNFFLCNIPIWLVVWNIWMIFPYIWNVIIPIDELIFFSGVGIPPTSLTLLVQCSSPQQSPKTLAAPVRMCSIY